MSQLLDTLLPFKDEKKKAWWENYVKHDSVFLGIPMATLRTLLNDWVISVEFSEITLTDQKACVIDLFSGQYAEEKLLGILLMSEHMKSVSDDEVLDLIEEIMSLKYISDWNICDWLCVKVLTPRLNKHDFSERLISWAESDYLWHRRAALVPFSRVSFATYSDVILKISSKLITSEERFSKTAVGWVLREMINEHKEAVISFMIFNKVYLTTEVINNILKHQSEKNEIKRLLK